MRILVAVTNQPFLMDTGFLVEAVLEMHGGRGGLSRCFTDEMQGRFG